MQQRRGEVAWCNLQKLRDATRSDPYTRPPGPPAPVYVTEAELRGGQVLDGAAEHVVKVVG